MFSPNTFLQTDLIGKEDTWRRGGTQGRGLVNKEDTGNIQKGANLYFHNFHENIAPEHCA